ncbi:MAG: hypothetical protein HC906_19535 [Bacteroidales bacterium]|nr:hypothetical protein [Bacteroidales bacterium]
MYEKTVLIISSFILDFIFLVLSLGSVYADGKTLLSENVFQGITISGKVTAALDGQPIIGVTVVEKGTQNGTITDLNGNYVITVSGKDAVLEFNFLGYNSEEIVVGEQTKLDVILIEKIEELSEVVVVGYGVQKKSDLTGAVAKVNSESLSRTGVNNVATALQGKAAGVFCIKGR